jgi:transcription elongation factor Elf1
MGLTIEARLGERVACRCAACGKVLVSSRSVVAAVLRRAGRCPVCGRAYEIRIEHAGGWAGPAGDREVTTP